MYLPVNLNIFWATRNFCTEGFTGAVVFKSLFTGTAPGWFEFPIEWKPCTRVRARRDGAWACLAHALQCLCDGRACCPALPKQLVICRFLRFHRWRCCFNSLFVWTGTGWIEISTTWKPCKRARARSGGAWAWLAHLLLCLFIVQTFCPALEIDPQVETQDDGACENSTKTQRGYLS